MRGDRVSKVVGIPNIPCQLSKTMNNSELEILLMVWYKQKVTYQEWNFFPLLLEINYNCEICIFNTILNKN